MKNKMTDFAIVISSCLVLGIFVDFAFNGIVIGFLSKATFTEKLAYIYCMVFFAVAFGLSNYLPETRFKNLTYVGVVTFLIGCFLGHVTFVGAHSTRVYIMQPDLQYTATEKTILFRSPTWQQVLFVSSDSVQAKMSEQFHNHDIPVVIEVISDYGCDREAKISTVAGIDVKLDRAANWVWQVDHKSAVIEPGPNTEDQNLFWCHRAPKISMFETQPGTRPWEEHQTTGDLKKSQ